MAPENAPNRNVFVISFLQFTLPPLREVSAVLLTIAMKCRRNVSSGSRDIVARSEAHDSGLCATDAETKRRFASDLLNLTLASPAVNRSQKSGKDATEWLPDLNRCWFASRVVEVRQQYALTIDRSERDVLESILSDCTSTAMTVVQLSRPGQTATPVPDPGGGQTGDALRLYDDNGNGRITCAEARSHGIAPVRGGHPAYPFMNDGDNDGVVCE